MNKYIIISLFILLSSCGQQVVIPVDQEVIDYSIGVTEIAWNDYFDDNISIGDMSFRNPLEIYYVEDIPEEGVRGVSHIHDDNTVIEVEYVNEYYWGTCVRMRYVLGHELLHYICQKKGICTPEENKNHDVPYVFAQWANDNDLSINDTVEMKMYWDVRHYCEDKWGKQ